MRALFIALLLAGACSRAVAQPLAQPAPDPRLYLEDLNNPAATQWADRETQKTLETVRKMPGFDERYKANLKVLTQREFNIQYPTSVGGLVYNNYRDALQPSGVWRSTTPDEYRKERPDWRVLFRVDVFNRSDAAGDANNWVWGGAQVQDPQLKGLSSKPQRALIRLTRGGSDAAIFREFDLSSRLLVPGSQSGFELPEAKGWATWWTTDELLVSLCTAPDNCTASGYPREVRLWKRGTALADARLIFRAEASDMSADWSLGFGPDGSAQLLLQRRISFNHYLHHVWDGQTAKPVLIPGHARARVEQGQVLFTTHNAWTTLGKEHAPGSLFSMPFADATRQPLAPSLLFEPGPRDVSHGGTLSSRFAAVNESRDMQHRVMVHTLDGSAAPREVQGLSPFGMSRLWLHDGSGDLMWLSHQSWLQPATLYLLNLKTASLEKIHAQGAAMDASGFSVEQGQAGSKDGTLIPYTLIGPKTRPRDGQQPTLLYGYGGFGIAVTADYQRNVLLNWLAQGGTYVVAHIRGGGELGNAWALAAKGLRRQVAFDDYIAVAEHLQKIGLTQPAKLGIYGASNGGLLTAAVLIQRPQLFGAVVSRVPLTDMQRFVQLLAGPSWVDEYGDPDQADQWAVMKTYSPYQNLKPGVAYPPTLYMANRNDDRVHPAHGRKMAAAQQLLSPSTWFYEPAVGGHGGIATPQLQAEREALIYTFLMGQLK